MKARLVESFINEAKNSAIPDKKDWDRMLDLYIKKDSGKRVANSIKDKNKAIARFVAGLRIMEIDGKDIISVLKDIENNKLYFDEFPNAFYDKAIELGATNEEVIDIYNKSEAPENIKNTIDNKRDKGIGIGAISNLCDKLDKAGVDVVLLTKKPVNANTIEGKDAMSRNGRIWTLGYRIEVTSKTYNKQTIDVDIITNEGIDDNTLRYVLGDKQDGNWNEYRSMGLAETVKYIVDYCK